MTIIAKCEQPKYFYRSTILGGMTEYLMYDLHSVSYIQNYQRINIFYQPSDISLFT